MQTPSPTASPPGTADPKCLSGTNDLTEIFPLREFTTIDDADFVSDTSITDILDMMPNGFNVDEFANGDEFQGATGETHLSFNPGEFPSHRSVLS